MPIQSIYKNKIKILSFVYYKILEVTPKDLQINIILSMHRQKYKFNWYQYQRNHSKKYIQ